MANRYLEKIARQVTDEYINTHANRAWWKGVGGGIAGGVIPIPGAGIVGNGVGRAHELAKVKKDITGKETRMRDVAGEATRSTARSIGREIAEGTGGAALGAAAGAGVGLLAKNPLAGAVVGGVTGLLTGGIHGSRASTRNSLRDFAHEWKNEKK